MGRMLLRASLVLVLMTGCGDVLPEGGGDGDGGGSVPADPAYVPPADRIDPPVVAMTFDDAMYHALGEARSGVDGIGQAPTTANAKYVSAATGDDANDGSEMAPWQTLQYAADTVAPDTTVYVDDSGDYTGGLEIRRSGAEGAWIVFANRDAGRAPRIVGGLDRDAVVDIDASWVAVVGFEIADHNRPGLDTDEIGILIEPHTTDVSHIQILNNWVHDIGPPGLTDMTCSYDAHAIIAQSLGLRISHLVIEGNEINDCYVGNSEVLVVNGLIEDFRVTGNYVHDVNNIAIDVIGYEKSPTETTARGLVADNVVLDASNYWPYGPPCSRGNCTYPIGDESSNGIYVDGGADIDIEYNVVGRADQGIELQSENMQLIRNVRVRFNVVFNSNFVDWILGPNENSFESDNQFLGVVPALVDADAEACKP